MSCRKIVSAMSALIMCSYGLIYALSYGTATGSFNGVTSYSNGTSSNVSNDYNSAEGINTGMKWQCVEYVNRYYYKVYGLDLRSAGIRGTTGNADQYYSNGSTAGLTQCPNGGTSIPQTGDILCSNGNGGSNNVGHVAIVKTVTANTVIAIQQNWYCDNRDTAMTLQMSVSAGKYTVSGFSTSYPIAGWLRNGSSTAPPTCTFFVTAQGSSQITLPTGYKFWKNMGTGAYSIQATITNPPAAYALILVHNDGTFYGDMAQSVSGTSYNNPDFNPTGSPDGQYKIRMIKQYDPTIVYGESPMFYFSALPTVSVTVPNTPLTIGQSATVNWLVSGGISGLADGGWTGDIRLQWYQNGIASANALANIVSRPVSQHTYTFTVPTSITGTTLPGQNFRIAGVNAQTGTSMPAGSVSGYSSPFSIIAPPTYTVIYNGNSNTGGSVPTDAITYSQSATVTVLGNTGSLSKTGYSFAGWNTAANGNGTSYVGGSTFTMGAANVTLYAQWTLIPTYTVTYNGNNNTSGSVPTDVSTYPQSASVTVLGNMGSLLKTGYTFAGWNTAANGSGTSYTGGATFTMGTASVTLYAVWTVNTTYTVTYNGNGNIGGSVPIDGNAYQQAATITVLGNTGSLFKTGYTFAGWNTAANGSGTSYVGGATFTMGTASVTLYAVWSVNPTFSVTYNGNSNTGGSVPTDGNSYQQAATVTVLGNTESLLKTGYTFANWNTVANGSGTSYAGGATFSMGTANVTLYAQWTVNPTYIVTYNGNGNTGGSVPADANSYLQGATITVLGNTGILTKPGSTFAGWNTMANGSGVSYAGGATFSMGAANVVLYAQWTVNPTYTVTYNGNGNTGGSVPADANSYLQGATITVLGNMGSLSKTGYTFAGWNTAANGSGTSYTGGTIFSMGTANVTLFAQWTVNQTYTVTYNGNGNTGGSVPTDANTYQQGATVTVLGNNGNLAKTGYTFTGWNTSANGSGTGYVGGVTLTMGIVNVILYAQWTPIPTYTVTYNENGNTAGSVPTDANTYQQGVTVTVLGNMGSLLKTGYSFAGWNTVANGSGTSYVGGSTLTMGTANITLYAQWTIIPTYSVTYNGNGNTGGSVPIDANTYKQGVTVAVLGNNGNLMKTGYAFAGWNTAANGSGTMYAGGATFSIGTTNMILYAQWNIITYTLSLAHIIGTDAPVADKDTVVNCGDTVRVTSPKVSGDVFIKWRITAGTAILLDSTAQATKIILTSGNTTLAAIYSKSTSVIGNQGHRIPTAFEISFNPGASSIHIGVPRVAGDLAVPVRVRLFSLRGELIVVLTNKVMQPGYYDLKFAGIDKLANNWGICNMEANGFCKSVKVLWTR